MAGARSGVERHAGKSNSTSHHAPVIDRRMLADKALLSVYQRQHRQVVLSQHRSRSTISTNETPAARFGEESGTVRGFPPSRLRSYCIGSVFRDSGSPRCVRVYGHRHGLGCSYRLRPVLRSDPPLPYLTATVRLASDRTPALPCPGCLPDCNTGPCRNRSGAPRLPGVCRRWKGEWPRDRPGLPVP